MINKETLIKYTPLQMGTALIMSRGFGDCINIPDSMSEYSMQRFTVITVSKICLLLLFLPLILFNLKLAKQYKYSTGKDIGFYDIGIKKNFFDIITEKNKAIGWILFSVFAVYLGCSFIFTVSEYVLFVTGTTMQYMPGALIIIFLAVVIIYGIFKGSQMIIRFGTVFFTFLCILFIMEFIALSGQEKWYYLYPAFLENAGIFPKQVLIEIAKNPEIMFFAILAKYVSGKRNLCVPIYIIGSMVYSIVLHLINILVNGEYLSAISYPTYSVALLSDIVLLERLDDLDAFIWTGGVILKLVITMVCVQTLLYSLTKKLFLSKIISGTYAFCLIIFLIFFDRRIILESFNTTLILSLFAVILFIIVPIAIFLIKKFPDPPSKEDILKGELQEV